MQPSTVYCDTCGVANRPQARFCIACGQAMAVGSMLPPTVQASPVVSSAAPTILAGSPPSALSLTGLLPAHSLLKQRYLILSQLGQGGMGAVYQAADTQLGDRLVAVKEMGQKGLDPQEVGSAATAFKREAHLLAGLPHHPHLPSMYDHFEDGGRWYLVMDFIAGETLADHVDKAGGKLPGEEVLRIGLQLTTVLEFLHSHQPPIIFRDLKPANIMRTPQGDLFLIDFGIARHFKAGQTKDTIAYGSAGYAAPEQYGKAQTTPRSDIYSLGATLHHLLTGLDPSLSPFIFAPLSNAGTQASLGALILRMVKTSANERPASMDEVKQELQRIQRLAAQPQRKQLPPTQYAGGSSLPPTQLAVPTPALAVPVQPASSKKPQRASPPSPPNASPPPGTVLYTYRGHSGSGYQGRSGPVITPTVITLGWSPDGQRIASGSNMGGVHVWDAATGGHVLAYQEHSGSVLVLGWSPDGKRIASGSADQTVQVWDATTGKTSLTYGGHTSGGHSGIVWTLAWSPDGKRIASGGNDGGYGSDTKTVQVWDAVTGGHVFTYRGHSDMVHTVAWSPDGRRIASGSDQTVQVWDVTTGKTLLTYQGHSNEVQTVAWSPDGRRLASGGMDKTVRAWDATTGKTLLTYQEHSGSVYALGWSPDGKRIASGSADQTVQVWDATTGKTSLTYRGHKNGVFSVAWSLDGTRIASGSADQTAQVWQVS
jgi:WD40 repeat protein